MADERDAKIAVEDLNETNMVKDDLERAEERTETGESKIVELDAKVAWQHALLQRELKNIFSKQEKEEHFSE